MAAVLADRFGEQPVSVFPMARRVGRRKCPVLALRREIVGWRTHTTARHVEWPVGPQVAAEAVRSQRQIVIEPDRKVPVACPLLRTRQLLIDLPLQVLIEFHAPPPLLAEGSRFLRTGILERLWPLGPQPEVGVVRVQFFVE